MLRIILWSRPRPIRLAVCRVGLLRTDFHSSTFHTNISYRAGPHVTAAEDAEITRRHGNHSASMYTALHIRQVVSIARRRRVVSSELVHTNLEGPTASSSAFAFRLQLALASHFFYNALAHPAALKAALCYFYTCVPRRNKP